MQITIIILPKSSFTESQIFFKSLEGLNLTWTRPKLIENTFSIRELIFFKQAVDFWSMVAETKLIFDRSAKTLPWWKGPIGKCDNFFMRNGIHSSREASCSSFFLDCLHPTTRKKERENFVIEIEILWMINSGLITSKNFLL